ncbi:MAG: cytochrome c maturation protein CcmE [Gaiellaceae bacterium]
MARRGSPARLVVALSVAALLAVFLVYVSIAGGGTPSLAPSELKGRSGEVTLAGRVLAPVRGKGREGGLRFTLRDVKGTTTVPVLYKDSVPDMFRVGRDVSLRGELKHGVFVGKPGSMITKCPSKYTAKKGT